MKTFAILAATLLSAFILVGCGEKTTGEKIDDGIENINEETEKGVKNIEKGLNDLVK